MQRRPGEERKEERWALFLEKEGGAAHFHRHAYLLFPEQGERKHPSFFQKEKGKGGTAGPPFKNPPLRKKSAYPFGQPHPLTRADKKNSRSHLLY